MNIHTDQNGPLTRLGLEGDLTIYEAAATKPVLMAALHDNEALEIDLSCVGEIDSAGIQLLLLIKREAKQSGIQLGLVQHSESVIELIQLFDLAADFGDPLLLAGNTGSH